ncbi:hypothetical protein KPA07_06175 [Corynebacterium aurimucosum]|uniref:hypothetical protein n=1 Tax=Corynebacterium aurimucosum TaxID=169292 RepID=UPI001C0E9425|nr:hypothetical protein [Corynebacterium aurimucosum]MBU5654498.1 hypothetical protein [Corynebacterium aurimucosum]
MTNYDRALAVLEAARRPGDLRIHPTDAVEALAEAGLLAPDLPDKAWDYMLEDGEYHVWEARGAFVDLSPKRQITVDHTRVWHTPEEARSIARTLLAAAQYKENTND